MLRVATKPVMLCAVNAEYNHLAVNAVCRYAECRYTECCGAVFTVDYFIMAVSYSQKWFVKFATGSII
jgi:hypothetical protein